MTTLPKAFITGPNDNDFELKVENINMDADGEFDTVIVESASSTMDKFRIKIQLGNGKEVFQEFEGDIWAETVFYCLDVNGDSRLEIVFRDFSTRSNADDQYSAIYSFDGATITSIPLTNTTDSTNYHQWDITKLDIVKIDALHYAINNGLSTHIYTFDIEDYRMGQYAFDGIAAEDIELYATNQYALSCWLVELKNGQYGFRINRFLELFFVTKGIRDMEPSVTVVLSSLVRLDDNVWALSEEKILDINEYYRCSEKYWKAINK